MGNNDAGAATCYVPRLTLAGNDAREFLAAVDRVKHALPGPVQRVARWWLYAYHVDVDKARTSGYVTATDGYRASRWVFHPATEGPAFCGPVTVADVDDYRMARNGELSLPIAGGISYPDVWRAAREAMRGAVRLGRVTSVAPLLRAVSAFERAGFDSIMIGIRGADVNIAAEDKEANLEIVAHVAGAMEGDAEAACSINPAYLAGALRAIERGSPSNSEVVAELSLSALRLSVMYGASVVAEEVIMTRRWTAPDTTRR
jgi:hypothetical protein